MGTMRALSRGQWGFDVAIAAAAVVIGQYELRFLPDSGQQGGPLALNTVLALLCAAPLAIRRRWPVTALAVATVPQVLASLLTVHALTFWGMGIPVAILCYSLARWSLRPRAALVALGAAVLMLGSYGIHVPAFVNVEDYVFGGLFMGAATAAGAVIAQLTRQRQALDAAMLRLRGQEKERRLQLLADERERIAREMHDVMAHGITVMVVQAGSARLELAADVDKARDALLIVEQTGRDVLGELRQTVDLLRNHADGGTEDPAPTLAQLPALVATMQAAGLDVRLELAANVQVDSGRARAAYRIVQEALTNSLRHAGPGTVHVTVSQPGDLHIDVVDGATTHGSSFPAGGGHGLAGMRERVHQFGGELVAGPESGGFAVRARIPLESGGSATVGQPLEPVQPLESTP